MKPQFDRLNNYSYCIWSISNDLYKIRKSYYPEERKPTLSHLHDFPQLWYCVKGVFSLVTEEKTYELTTGQIFVVPPGMNHIFLVPENMDAEIISADVRFDFFNNTQPGEYINTKRGLFMHYFSKELRLPVPEPITLSNQSRAILQENFSKLVLNQLAGVPNIESEAFALFESTFSLPELRLPQESAARAEVLWREKIQPILRVVGYINKNYAEKILVEDMLKMSCLGHTIFFSTFKKIIGDSFSSYLQQIRLWMCHSMMAHTNFSMAYIAAFCGFCNQSHMERAYKKYAGKLPKKARAHSKEWWKEQAEKEAQEKAAAAK